MARIAFEQLTANVDAKLNEVMGGRRNTGLLLAAAACAILPLEISHLVSMIVGVLAYMLIQTLHPNVSRSRNEPRAVKATIQKPVHPWNNRPQGTRRGGALSDRNPSATTQRPASWSTSQPGRAAAATAEVSKPEIRKPSAVPVQAPTFKGEGWEAEVKELLLRIAPTPEGDALVERIARAVQRVVAPIIPEAEVTGFASGNVNGGTAFGVAVPEVDIVISVNPAALLGRLQGRWRMRGAAERLDAQKLQKSAIRACTDRLVGTGVFKFRRSAFRGPEPKVTIIAPSGDGSGQGVPLNLSVNAVTPLYNAALLAECGRLEPRARELILFVKRWAKDRGLCHAAKGHFSPYVWTLVVIFFCQVYESEDGPLLPPLEGFETCSGLMKARPAQPKRDVEAAAAKAAPAQGASPKRSAAALFKDFATFFAKDFDWRKEAISVRLGKRAPPDQTLPLHIVLHGEAGSSEVGPSIEDPFEPSQNLGASTTAASLAHLHSELRRAEELCAGGASLSKLLEPWAPPEAGAGGKGEDEDEQ